MSLNYIYITESWTEACTSCDIDSDPSEESAGIMTLEECKQSCVEDEECTAIDYGSNDQSCYLNYGGLTSYKQSDFDAYTLKRKHGYIYLHTQMVLLNSDFLLVEHS